MNIEEYLERPYWVIDILPKQVPADSSGQYFRIAEYYLEHPQMVAIYRKFTNILLKLNCFEDLEASLNGEEWTTNPAPKAIEAMLTDCLAAKSMLYIMLKPADAMIVISGDDTYMTVYNPSEETLDLLGALASSEGLFIWKPKT